MEYLGNTNLFASHFIIGTKDCETKAYNNIASSLRKWLDYKDNDPFMGKYRTKNTQFVDFSHYIDIKAFQSIITDLVLIYKKAYPYSKKQHFLNHVFTETLNRLESFIETDFIPYGTPTFNCEYDFFVASTPSYERLEYVIESKYDIDFIKQYFKTIIEIINNIDFENIKQRFKRTITVNEHYNLHYEYFKSINPKSDELFFINHQLEKLEKRLEKEYKEIDFDNDGNSTIEDFLNDENRKTFFFNKEYAEYLKNRKSIFLKLKNKEFINYEDVFFVHYQCDNFNEGEQISALCIYSDGKAKEYLGNESENIKDFTLKVNELLSEGLILVHWNQDRPNYGTDHINKRYKELTGKNLNLEYRNQINLAEWLIFIYGQDYISHPRLDNLAKLNQFYGIRETELGQKTFATNRLLLLTKIYFNALHKTLKTNINAHQSKIIDNEKKELKTLRRKFDIAINELDSFYPIINTAFTKSSENINYCLFKKSIRELNQTFRLLIGQDSIDKIISEAKLYLNEEELKRFYIYTKEQIQVRQNTLDLIIESLDRNLSDDENLKLEEIFHTHLEVGLTYLPRTSIERNKNFTNDLIDGIKKYFNLFESNINKIYNHNSDSKNEKKENQKALRQGLRVTIEFSYFNLLKDYLNTNLLASEIDFINYISKNQEKEIQQLEESTDFYFDDAINTDEDYQNKINQDHYWYYQEYQKFLDDRRKELDVNNNEIQSGKITNIQSTQESNEINIKPSISENHLEEILNVLNPYFDSKEHQQLRNILSNFRDTNNKLLFKGQSNRLSDTFKQLIEKDIIIGVQKKDIIEWITSNFKYLNKKTPTEFKYKSVEAIISGNQTPCKNPLIEIINGTIIKKH
ncbi:hypothetical protein [Neptunitalea lumnitzerae]|nr:hypothetical protein [Neptunitalea sp. Y10]